MKPGKTGVARIIAASGYSIKGLAAAFRGEAAFRQELLLCALLLPLSFWLANGPMQWLALVAPLFVLLIVELLNSAVEAVVDRTGAEHHVLSGQAKDMGSAAVMLALAFTAVCWLTVAWERFGAGL
jgi:diacylglycerol kinase (ATP)